MTKCRKLESGSGTAPPKVCVRPRSIVALTPILVFGELRTILYRTGEACELECWETRELVVKVQKKPVCDQNIVRIHVGTNDLNVLLVVDEVECLCEVRKQLSWGVLRDERERPPDCCST
jgi:hypothetical protein